MHVVKQEWPLTREEEIAKAFKEKGLQIAAILDGYDVPADKIDDVVEYGITMQAKQPQMKVDRIARKIAEYFKLKLKPKDNGSSEI